MGRSASGIFGIIGSLSKIPTEPWVVPGDRKMLSSCWDSSLPFWLSFQAGASPTPGPAAQASEGTLSPAPSWRVTLSGSSRHLKHWSAILEGLPQSHQKFYPTQTGGHVVGCSQSRVEGPALWRTLQSWVLPNVALCASGCIRETCTLEPDLELGPQVLGQVLPCPFPECLLSAGPRGQSVSCALTVIALLWRSLSFTDAVSSVGQTY